MRPRVGLLCYGLERPLSGTTRVAHQLGEALHATDACDVVYLTTYRRGPFRAAPYRSLYLPGCRLLPGLLMFGSALVAMAARHLRLDVVHDPVGVSPFAFGRWAGSFARVLTMHDAIAYRFPQGYPWLNNTLHRHYVPATLRNVDAIITVSQHTRRELVALAGARPSNVHVVPNGVAPHFRPVAAQTVEHVLRRHGIARPYVLSVGAQQARKNVAGLVAAFAQLRQDYPPLRLVIVGPQQWHFSGVTEAIREFGVSDAVTTLGYVDEVSLPALYCGAEAFALVSLYEGFGIPVLEAMACGAPVVCANTSATPEVAGNAAILVDPTDPLEIAEGLRAVIGDTARRKELRREGMRRARAFTWARAATETVDVYHRTLAARGG